MNLSDVCAIGLLAISSFIGAGYALKWDLECEDRSPGWVAFLWGCNFVASIWVLAS